MISTAIGSIGVEPQPGIVNTTVPYWTNPPPDEYLAGSVSQYRRKHDRQPTQIHDLRGIEQDFHVDEQGFQVLQHKSVESTFEDEKHIKAVVYKETEELLRSTLGASKAHCFSHLVRRGRPEIARAIAADPTRADNENMTVAVPSPGAHIDHSNVGAVQIVEDNFSKEEASRLQEQHIHWAIINLWRPVETVYRDPLCLCDARSVDEKDLHSQVVRLPVKGGGLSFDSVSKGASFGTVAVTANTDHKWYYLSHMRPDEVFLIRIYDSKIESRVSSGIPHTSFMIPGTEDAPTRQSIELRCLVIFED